MEENKIKSSAIEFSTKETSGSHSVKLDFSLDKFLGFIGHMISVELIKTNSAEAQGLVISCIFHMVDNRIPCAGMNKNPPNEVENYHLGMLPKERTRVIAGTSVGFVSAITCETR